eukprot:3455909-Alexandrium_andersonii.AAC.1
MGSSSLLATPVGAGEVDSGVDQARGIHGVSAVLALVEVHNADARDEGKVYRLPEVEQGARRQ